jgi:phosphoribosyl-AMP cyclohydrolase
MEKKKNYKCLFYTNPWLPSEKIWFKDWVSVDKLTEYVKDSFLCIDSIKMNCNKDTILIPGQFEYRQKWIEAINWSKITSKESLFQNEETIPVILKWFAWIIYYIANMNEEALDNTMNEWKLWGYSKTNQKLQQKWATSWDYIKVSPETFLYWSTQNWWIIWQLNCYPVNNSVCHTKNQATWKWYETCFFRWIEEVMREIKTKISSIPSI